eukprot:CAMPEP_0185041674 /NCGR_PEP_ID=MMETSP1103-20130426/41301_1 /TAXON_ID=36769 /ORGANISM="Paraphysomonas bandaiensis, Strain Caron Lab Isolate" /LENGTH=62 /DNA_ID=CAMNT_0027581521 /DNA_START=156 /DNA_END=344 /DNA_ORIENTATION=+
MRKWDEELGLIFQQPKSTFVPEDHLLHEIQETLEYDNIGAIKGKFSGGNHITLRSYSKAVCI